MNIMDKFQEKRLGVSEGRYKESEKIAAIIWKTLFCEGKVIDPFMHMGMNKWLAVIEGLFIISMTSFVLLFYNEIYNLNLPKTGLLIITSIFILLFLSGKFLAYRYDMKQFNVRLEEIVKWGKKLEKTEEGNEGCGVKKFIVPISITYNTSKRYREVIVETEDEKTAMLIAIGDFQRDGWIVDIDYENYKQFRE